MKNRKHGEGSVSFDNTRKKWRVAFYDADDKRHYKRFDNEKSAREYLIEQINEVNKGSFIAPSKLTVGEWSIEYLETYKRNSVKATTYAHYLDQARHLSEIADICIGYYGTAVPRFRRRGNRLPGYGNRCYSSISHMSGTAVTIPNYYSVKSLSRP